MDGIDAAQANEGLYLQGSVGTGKTTRAAEHLQALLDRGVPAEKSSSSSHSVLWRNPTARWPRSTSAAGSTFSRSVAWPDA